MAMMELKEVCYLNKVSLESVTLILPLHLWWGGEMPTNRKRVLPDGSPAFPSLNRIGK